MIGPRITGAHARRKVRGLLRRLDRINGPCKRADKLLDLCWLYAWICPVGALYNMEEATRRTVERLRSRGEACTAS
jgi:hypothetical protein